MCGCEIFNNRTRIKGGSICVGCASTLPLGVRESGRDFTAKKLQQIQKNVKVWRDGPIWRHHGSFMVSASSVVLNGIEYNLKNLRSIQLNFHPWDVGRKPNTAIGTATVVLETKKPHVLIEEAFTGNTYEVGYAISGMDITYRFPNEIEKTIQGVRDAILAGESTIPEAARDARRFQQERRTEKKWRQEQSRTETPLESALKLYGLQQPYTLETLKKKRNDMLRTQPIHPDNGGSDEKFKQFQAAYEILSKFTAG